MGEAVGVWVGGWGGGAGSGAQECGGWPDGMATIFASCDTVRWWCCGQQAYEGGCRPAAACTRACARLPATG